MKKLLLVFLLGIFLVGTVSASFEFDNVIRSEKWNEVTIKDSILGIPTTTVGVIKLVNYTGEGFVGEDYLYYDLDHRENGVSFKGSKHYSFFQTKLISNRVSDYEIYDANAEYEVDTFKTTCQTLYSNSTPYEQCTEDKTGTKTMYGKYIPYDISTKLTSGNYSFRERINVGEGETVDVIPNFYGVDITQWIFFTGFQRFEELNFTGFDTDEVASENQANAQSFTQGTVGLNVPITLKGIELILRVSTLPAADGNNTFLIVSEVDASGKPSTFLTFNNTFGSLIDGTFQSYNITLPGDVILRAGTQYAWIIGIDEGNGGTRVQRNESSLYSGGGAISNSSVSDWGAVSSTGDFQFIIWGLQLPLQVNLSAPANNSRHFAGRGVIFNSSVSPSPSTSLTNATLSIWDSDSILFNRTTQVITGESINESIINVTLDTVGTFQWNVFGCSANVTDTVCAFAASNKTFQVDPFIINSETFNNITTEGNTETFEINITTILGLQLSRGEFFYNGSSQGDGVLTRSGLSNEYVISKSITIPNVNQNINKTFLWSIIMEDGTNQNSTSNNQSVLNLVLDDCSSGSVLILNYTLKDEDTQIVMNGTEDNTTIEVDVSVFSQGTSTEIFSFSNNFSKVNPAQICLNANLSNSIYDMDVITKYFTTIREVEYHNIQNFTLTNLTIPQNIDLLDLLSSESTEFLVSFKGSDFILVSDALITITRLYVADGQFKTVEVPKTDSLGQTVVHLVRSDGRYTIIVSKKGVILATFNNVVAVCADPTIDDCQLNLNPFSEGTKATEFELFGNLNAAVEFDSSTRTITTTFNTIDGSSAAIAMNGTLFDTFQNTTACRSSLVSSSGVLTCTIPESFGNASFIMHLYNGDQLITTKIVTLEPDPFETFGYDGIIVLLIFVVTLLLMFISSLVGVIVGAILGFILSALLIVYTGGSMFGLGSTIIWIIMAGGILAWKIMKESGG